ncbi:hypothetical protein DUT91_21580 [Phyllobacterium salinisoli]|uniref:Uncharacterized protein n=1 Tax=Phyllobacterium salinisoli TaxID=1899321 RepID=A0A368JXL5_9HYPH|nr:hypothetical protein DUT91_21580 [Phyllobacterium salinisoli]
MTSPDVACFNSIAHRTDRLPQRMAPIPAMARRAELLIMLRETCFRTDVPIICVYSLKSAMLPYLCLFEE